MFRGRAPPPLVGYGAILVASSVAVAEEPVSVWYHATEGCPTAASFLERLSAHGVAGRVAQAGDRIDFVVTLEEVGKESSGALERQSSQGTVALREVHAASCDAVADALILTLALALGPEQSRVNAVEAPLESPQPMPEPTVVAPTNDEPPAPPVTATPAPASLSAVPVEAPAPWSVRVGVQGTVASLVGTSPLWGASVFGDVRSLRAPRLSARASFVIGFASDPIPNVDIRVLAGRLELCPLSLGDRLTVNACAALDLGAIRAASSAPNGQTDQRFWSVAWAVSRLDYTLGKGPVGLELQGGVGAPLTRYQIAAGEPRQTVAEMHAIDIGLAAGASVRLP
jgi:hypothetical protein